MPGSVHPAGPGLRSQAGPASAVTSSRMSDFLRKAYKMGPARERLADIGGLLSEATVTERAFCRYLSKRIASEVTPAGFLLATEAALFNVAARADSEAAAMAASLTELRKTVRERMASYARVAVSEEFGDLVQAAASRVYAA